MILFRTRARAHGVDPDAYVCPPEGEVIYERIAEMETLDEAVGYALGSLDHFEQLLAVYRAAADGEDAAAIDARPRGRRPQRQTLRPLATSARRAGAAGRGARALPGARARRDAALCRLSLAPTFKSSSASLPRTSPRAWRFARAARRRAPARWSQRRAARSATRRGSTPARSWPTCTRTGPAAHRPRPRDRPAPARAADLRGLPRYPRAGAAGGASGDRRPTPAGRRSSPTSPPARHRTCSRRSPSGRRRGRSSATSTPMRSRAPGRPRTSSAWRSGCAALPPNAFDRAALAALDPRPDVVLELGLYGIYHDDA